MTRVKLRYTIADDCYCDTELNFVTASKPSVLMCKVRQAGRQSNYEWTKSWGGECNGEILLRELLGMSQVRMWTEKRIILRSTSFFIHHAASRLKEFILVYARKVPGSNLCRYS